MMVANVHKNHRRNQHSILTTDIPIKTTSQCVDFYYYMYSNDGCDVVRFSATLKCVGFKDEVIIKTSGSRKKGWNYVLFDVDKPVGTKCQVNIYSSRNFSVQLSQWAKSPKKAV